MSKQIEALKLALEALEDLMGWQTLAPADTQRTAHKAITAIKEALAQPDPYKQGYADAMNWKVQNHLEHLPTAKPEQEPVAHWSDCAVHSDPAYPKGECDCGGFPPQRTWVGLTDEEKKDLCRWWSSPIDAIYATEARLKELNT